MVYNVLRFAVPSKANRSQLNSPTRDFKMITSDKTRVGSFNGISF